MERETERKRYRMKEEMKESNGGTVKEIPRETYRERGRYSAVDSDVSQMEPYFLYKALLCSKVVHYKWNGSAL